MKKIVLSTFSFVLALLVSVSANASSLDSVISGNFDESKDRESTSINAKIPVKNKIGKSKVNSEGLYIAVTEGLPQYISGSKTNYYKVKVVYDETIKGNVTYKSYYNTINGKVVNYKADTQYIYEGKKYTFTANFSYNTSLVGCDTNETGFDCVNMLNGKDAIIDNESGLEQTLSNINVEYVYKRYSLKSPAEQNKIIYQDHRKYHSNGKLYYQDKLTLNEAGVITKEDYYEYTSKGSLAKKIFNNGKANTYAEYKGYHSNGKLAYTDITYRTSTGALSKVLSYDYDSRARLVSKNYRNSKNYTYFREARRYYSNNRLYERTYAYLTGTSSNKTKSSYYFKYRSNGTKYVYKKMYFSSRGYITRMYSYVYNTKSQLKSNKYGSAYKYTTYFKTNTNLIYKTTKAKYSSGGRLGKAVTIRPTTFTRTYYKGY